MPQVLTHLWLGTSACEVHCCGSNRDLVPVCSVPTLRPPLRIEPLSLMHSSESGSAILAILCAGQSTSDGATHQVLLISTLGETLRSFGDVEGWRASDFLGLGYPQLLLLRPSLAYDPGTVMGKSALTGYVMAGLSSTFKTADASPVADAAVTSGGSGTGATTATHRAAVVRRRQLLGVASALSDRLSLGYEAIARAKSEASERALLTAHAQRLLIAQADATSQRAATSYEERGRHPSTPATAAAVTSPNVDGSLLVQWQSTVHLAPVLPLSGVPPAPVVAPPAPRVPTAASPSLAEPRVLRLAHHFRHGFWILGVTVCNHGQRDCAALSSCVVHPQLALHARSSVSSMLAPAEVCTLTVAVPMAAVVGDRALELDLLLTWRAPCETGASVTLPKDVAAAGQQTAGGEIWCWHRRIATCVRVDSGRLFESTQVAGAGRSAPLSLPPSLSRCVALVLEAPAGSRTLLELPQTLAGTLGLHPVHNEAGALGTTMAGAPRGATQASAPTLYRTAHGSCGGSWSVLEARVWGVGRCVEITLGATGEANDAVLCGAVGALRAALPSATRIDLSAASAPILDSWRRACLTMQAELMGTTKAFEDFLKAPDRTAAAQLPAAIAGLQSATDARMSVLHAICGGAAD